MSAEHREGSGSFTQTYSYLSGENKILLAKAGNGELTLYLDGQGIDEHLGEVSRHGALGFAIYLSHFVFIKLLDWRIRVFPDSIAQNPYIYTFSAVALTLIATELSHLVEKHYIERGKRVTTEILRSARATLPGLATG